MANWPVSPANSNQMDSLRTSHYVNPIPAYDVDGNLIRPLDYERKLKGALLEIEFTLSRSYFKEREENGKVEPAHFQFVADILRIKVLAPPAATMTSPQRSRVKLSRKDPGSSGSPSKRGRSNSTMA